VKGAESKKTVLRNLVVFFALSAPLALSAQTPPLAQSTPPFPPVVLTHVTVIDATGAAPRPDVEVAIAAGRITAIGQAVQVPRGAQIIDESGKFMIPGLWDMHTHLNRASEKRYLALYLANGVTGVRFMWGGRFHHEWRGEIESGALLGPRMVIASLFVDGPRPIHPGMSIAVSNAAEGREAVRTIKSSGADFIKIYSLIPRDAYFAIADEAKKEGVIFAGHVPRDITAAEASDAGQRSIEHVSAVPFDCSEREPQYRTDLAQLQAELAVVGPPGNYYRLLRAMEGKYLAAYDGQKCAALFARFVRNHTWQVPTLDVVWSGARLADPDFVDPLRKYLPLEERTVDARQSSMYRTFTAADYAGLKAILARQEQIVGEMQQAGVSIMAGTDIAPVGFALHEELALMVEAGLSPMQALQAATRNPARYLGLSDSLGTVEPGKLADLVLLEANPLVAISNTRKIDAVVVRGRLLRRRELDQMVAVATE
jgi:hypothetical protein